jgi:hypothetical protein
MRRPFRSIAHLLAHPLATRRRRVTLVAVAAVSGLTFPVERFVTAAALTAVTLALIQVAQGNSPPPSDTTPVQPASEQPTPTPPSWTVTPPNPPGQKRHGQVDGR